MEGADSTAASAALSTGRCLPCAPLVVTRAPPSSSTLSSQGKVLQGRQKAFPPPTSRPRLLVLSPRANRVGFVRAPSPKQ